PPEVYDPCDAQDKGRIHIVAGDRKAVLPAFDRPVRRKESARATGPPRRPVRNDQSDTDKEKEHCQGHRHYLFPRRDESALSAFSTTVCSILSKRAAARR